MGYGKSLLVAPAAEPLSLARAKSHLRIDSTEDDDILTNVWIPAARRLVEKATDRCLITQTWRITRDAFPYGVGARYNVGSDAPTGVNAVGMTTLGDSILYDIGIRLPVSPVQSVIVRYYDVGNVLQTLDSSSYELDTSTLPVRVMPVYTAFWPATRTRLAAVQLDVLAGYGDAAAAVPAELVGVMLLQLELWFNAGEHAPTSNLSQRVADILRLNWSGDIGG